MPRTDVFLVKDVWTQLGVAGELILTVKKAGNKTCLFNEVQADAGAIEKGLEFATKQIAQNSATESTHAKALGDGWVITVDQ